MCQSFYLTVYPLILYNRISVFKSIPVIANTFSEDLGNFIISESELSCNFFVLLCDFGLLDLFYNTL